MPTPDLIIFDCDGVLVDSEPISNRILAEDISRAGWEMTTEDSISRFKGGRLTEVKSTVEAHIGKSLGETWINEHYERAFEAFRQEITPIPGVLELLVRLTDLEIPFCVASQGPVRKMEITLGKTGIWPFVDGHVYSADMVERPKPAPDLFLYAAGQENAAPKNCAVVEDSTTGVRAARAAHMRIIGFSPDSPSDLAAAGAESVISDMSKLLPVIVGETP